MWLSVERRKLFKQLASVVPADEAQHNITRGRIAQIDDLIRAVEPERLLEAAEPPDYFDD